jgi:hypothetical protein
MCKEGKRDWKCKKRRQSSLKSALVYGCACKNIMEGRFITGCGKHSQHSVKKEARLTFDITHKEYSGTFTEGKCSEMTSLGKVQLSLTNGD